jgi:hypothetical protein
VVLENFTARSASEGIILHNNQGFAGATKFVLKRFDYGFDPRYTGLTKYDGPWGLAAVGWADTFLFEDVWINDYAGLNYLIMNDQRYGVSSSSSVQPNPGIRAGQPPGGEFAPRSSIGMNYVSPYPIP